jgi:hypothetical protein
MGGHTRTSLPVSCAKQIQSHGTVNASQVLSRLSKKVPAKFKQHNNQTVNWMTGGQFLAMTATFSVTEYTPAVWYTQLCIQWVMGSVFLAVTWPSEKLTNYLYLVPDYGYSTFKWPCWYLNFITWFMKNVLLEQKKTKLWNKQCFVENITKMMQHVLNMQRRFLLPVHIKWNPGVFFNMRSHMWTYYKG